MAWCDECDRVVEDNRLDENGACPTCGTVLTEPHRRPIPWTFKVMVVAFVVYLGYRGYQGIAWLAHHL
jgi:uncharacterized paraquat-inducible protein A